MENTEHIGKGGIDVYKRIWLLLIGCLLVGLVAGGPTFAQELRTLTVGLPGTVHSLDPAAYRDRMTEGVVRAIFDGLVEWGFDMQPQLEIAESWKWIDNTTLQYKIRKGITFHNGEPLTSEDVEFSLNRVIKEVAMCGETSPRKGLVTNVESISCVDPYTVRLHLSMPSPTLPRMLSHQQIVPKDYLEEIMAREGGGCEEFREYPVGAGPFKFVEWKKGEYLVVDRYEGYYGDFPGNVDRIVFKMIPEEASRIAALKTGEIDIALDISLSQLPVLEADPNILVKSAMGTRGRMVEMNVTKPPFDDVRVRWAMNYAVDIQEIVDALYLGKGTVFAGPLLSADANLSPYLEPYGYDPDKARALLTEAGYPDGFPLIIDAVSPHIEWAQAVANYLRDAGIDASVRIWEYKIVKPELLACNRQMFVRDWGCSGLDPVGYLDAKVVCGGRGNYSCYCNPKADALIELAAAETNPDIRKGMYWAVQEILYYDAPWIFGYSVDEVGACGSWVDGWEAHPISYLFLENVTLKD